MHTTDKDCVASEATYTLLAHKAACTVSYGQQQCDNLETSTVGCMNNAKNVIIPLCLSAPLNPGGVLIDMLASNEILPPQKISRYMAYLAVPVSRERIGSALMCQLKVFVVQLSANYNMYSISYYCLCVHAYAFCTSPYRIG